MNLVVKKGHVHADLATLPGSEQAALTAYLKSHSSKSVHLVSHSPSDQLDPILSACRTSKLTLEGPAAGRAMDSLLEMARSH